MDIKTQDAQNIAHKLMDASRKLADKAFECVNDKNTENKEMTAVIVELDSGKVRVVYDD